MKERVQKIMARAGLGSRRQCETIIAAGRVRVNGRSITLGDKADPDQDHIEVDGKPLNVKDEKHTYIALNKPKGVISSLEDELNRGRTTVRDLIDLPGHIYPVGRLDKQSEGLILMTDDGDLAHKLTHPRYGHEKTYRVTVEGAIPAEAVAQWRKGVMLNGRRTAPAVVKIQHQQTDHTNLTVILREGRKRQIRRVAAQFGHPVTRLIREKIGPLALGNLKPGQWRHLTPAEVTALRRAVARPQKRKGKRKKRRR